MDLMAEWQRIVEQHEKTLAQVEVYRFQQERLHFLRGSDEEASKRVKRLLAGGCVPATPCLHSPWPL